MALAAGKPVEKATKWSGGEKKVELQSRLLTPVPITRDNLDVVVKAGWIKKDDLCKGVSADKAPAAWMAGPIRIPTIEPGRVQPGRWALRRSLRSSEPAISGVRSERAGS